MPSLRSALASGDSEFTIQQVNFLNFLELMWHTHYTKAMAYSGRYNEDTYANFRKSEKLGVPAHIGTAVRMSDKFERLANLLRDPNNQVDTEGVLDTLLDIAIYAPILQSLYLEATE